MDYLASILLAASRWGIAPSDFPEWVEKQVKLNATQ